MTPIPSVPALLLLLLERLALELEQTLERQALELRKALGRAYGSTLVLLPPNVLRTLERLGCPLSGWVLTARAR